jgi:ABC-type amino acid transport substrate-binding protein
MRPWRKTRVKNQLASRDKNGIPGLTWAEMLDELKNRTVDVITPTRNTREREEFMSFMQPCIATPLSIVTRKDHYWF